MRAEQTNVKIVTPIPEGPIPESPVLEGLGQEGLIQANLMTAVRVVVAPAGEPEISPDLPANNDSPEQSLEALVQGTGQGDCSAFAELFARVAPQIKGYLMSLGTGQGQAEEIAQDVMVAIWQKAHTFDSNKAAASTWIYRIARNRRIDLWRREHRLALDPHEPLLHGPAPVEPFAALDAAEQARRVRMAVARLPENLSTVLKLAYFEGLTHVEIAATLKIPLGTVKSRIRKATKNVRAALDLQTI